MKAVTLALGTYLFMHIHSLFLNFQLKEKCLRIEKGSISAHHQRILITWQLDKMHTVWLSYSCAKLNKNVNVHVLENNVHFFSDTKKLNTYF